MSLNLIGAYDCRLDAKGRVMIPVTLKSQLQPVLSRGLILKRSVFRKCIEVYPMPEWEKIMKGISKLNRFNRKHNDFIRIFMAGVRQVELDGTGRLQIPKDLAVFAGLSNDIVVATTAEVIEIWDKELYEATLTEYTDIGDLAEEVLGGIDFNE